MTTKADHVIGKAVDRVDGKLKVTGQAKYSADINLPNMAYAVLVQSTIPAGKISSIDSSLAEKSPGVIAVLTHQNAPRLKKSDTDKNNAPILQDNIIRFAGQNIAVVVASTLEAASTAARLVKVDYKVDKSITDADSKAAKLLDQLEHNPENKRGDIDAGVKAAQIKISNTYSTPTESHNPMEPFATVAHFNGDNLTVYETTQGVFPSKKTISEITGIPANNITVITHFLGGGFGCKLSVWSNTILAILAAQKVNRPVKLVLKRSQMYGPVGFRPKTIQRLSIGASKDGKLTFIKHVAINESAIFRDFTESVTEPTSVTYECRNVITAVKPVPLNIGSPTWMRAPGDAPGSFALESAMDELAYALAIDPIDLRLKNFASKNPEDGLPWTSNSLKECYKIGAEKFAWKSRNPKVKSMRKGKLLVGMGMASANHPTYRSEAGASIILHPDGRVIVRSGTQDIGTGTYTIMAQVAADVLGVPISKVKIELGETTFPQTPMSGGSQTAASVCSAIDLVARQTIEKVINLSINDENSPHYHADAKSLQLKDGVVISNAGKKDSIADILKRKHLAVLEITGKASANKGKDTHSRRSFGAQFAEVQIDPELGKIHVSKLLGVYSAGKILNPKTARSQMIGGLIWGMSMALFEETLMDHNLGRIVNNDFAEYHIPVHADMPEFEVVFVPEDDSLVNPVGAKGIGELGINGAAAAVCNAIYHATGKRIRSLPITLDQLL